jgi:ferrous iron transport protein B
VLLQQVWGSFFFLATMFVLFQVIFTVAALLQDQITSFFEWLGLMLESGTIWGRL